MRDHSPLIVAQKKCGPRPAEGGEREIKLNKEHEAVSVSNKHLVCHNFISIIFNGLINQCQRQEGDLHAIGALEQLDEQSPCVFKQLVRVAGFLVWTMCDGEDERLHFLKVE